MPTGMPPVLHLPNVIPGTANRGLELQYASSPLNRRQSQDKSKGSSNGNKILPARRHSSNANMENISEEQRSLPARSVTDENFDETYVSFIMCCNPTIPSETDTTELKKIFRAPPKSDGKSFSTYTLFQLIKKLELKEIKTWAQLAIDLGVEPPDFGKGQSSQKVQQYSVRLKRWMHAMHVDAFFEYLLNKPHVYWTQIPSVHEPVSEFGRDGVVAEEDLALRALLPETRPKRGRRKAEDKDENDTGKSPSQRPRLDSPTLSEEFMIARTTAIGDNPTPSTGNSSFQQGFHDRMVPWSATTPIPSNFRWPPPDIAQTPLSAYPQSAITPSTRTQLWNDANEPRSAVTPKSRSRRRHGPAVSSAWPSNGNTSSGKLRGRPPNNRSVQDGPFSTFPVNPGSRDVPTINLRDNTPAATPVVADSEMPHFFPTGIATNPPNPPTQNNRPSRLQLQVPERQGGAVRLATPPLVPSVLVNGEGNTNMHQELPSNSHHVNPLMAYFSSPGDLDPNFQNSVSIAIRQNESTDRTNMDALESHFTCEILSADWYDASGARIERCSIVEADKICKQVIKNLKAESSSTEAFLINLSALAGGPLMTPLRMTKRDYGPMTYYECHWKMRFGSIEGDFTIKANVDHDPNSRLSKQDDIEASPDEPEEWRRRYLELRQQIRDRDETVWGLKRNILDALVVSNQYSYPMM